MFMQGLSVEFYSRKLFFVLVDIKGRYTRTQYQKRVVNDAFCKGKPCISL